MPLSTTVRLLVIFGCCYAATATALVLALSA